MKGKLILKKFLLVLATMAILAFSAGCSSKSVDNSGSVQEDPSGGLPGER